MKTLKKIMGVFVFFSALLSCNVGYAEDFSSVVHTTTLQEETTEQEIEKNNVPESSKSEPPKDFVQYFEYKGSIRAFYLQKNVTITAEEFFTSYGSSFGLDADDTLKKFKERSVKDTVIYVFQQYYRGVPIRGAEYTLREKKGSIVSGIGTLVSDIYINTKPAITENRALEVVEQNLGVDPLWISGQEYYEQPDGELIIVSTNPDGEFENAAMRLVYHFDYVPAGDGTTMFFDVDAHNGDVLAKGKNEKEVFENVEIPVPQKDFFDNYVTFRTKRDIDTNTYVLGLLAEAVDTVVQHPELILKCWTYSAPVLWWEDKGEFTDAVLNDDDVFNSNACNNGKVGVSIMKNIQTVMAFFENNFSWYGYDGIGKQPIEIGMLEMKVYPFYDPKTKRIGFPVFSGFATHVNYPGYILRFSVNSEVLAHEFTHGITHDIFQPANVPEMNAIDESLCDIMALVVKNKTGNFANWIWLYGDDFVLSHPANKKKAIRDFADPNSMGHPDTYHPDVFSGPKKRGPHEAAGISNHWFYLLSEGSNGEKVNDLGWKYNVLPIGVDNATTIVFKTMTENYLHSTDNFMQFRLATLMATQDLIDEGDLNINTLAYVSVMNAWHAVGVGDNYESQKKYVPFDGQPNVPAWPSRLSWQISYPQLEKKWIVRVSNNPDFLDQGETNGIQNVTYTSNPIMYATDFMGVMMSFANFNLKPETTYYWQAQIVQVQEDQCKQYAELVGKGSLNERICDGLLNQWGNINSFKTGPMVPELFSPHHEEANFWPWKGEFVWQEVEGAIGYIVQISQQTFTPEHDELLLEEVADEDNQFFSIVQMAMYHGDQKLEKTLKINQAFYWRVLPIGPEEGYVDINAPSQPPGISERPQYGGWSNKGTGSWFKTALPSTTLTSTYEGTLSPWRIPVVWEEVRGAAEYGIQIATDPSFEDGTIISGGTMVIEVNDKFSNAVSLPSKYDKMPLWLRVLPVGPEPYREIGSSSIAEFTIDYNLTKPILEFPAPDEEISYNSDISFRWKPVENVLQYRLGIDKGKTWTYPIDATFVDTTNTKVVSAAKSSTHKEGYCWAVRALGPGGLEGVMADPRCYTIGPSVPILVSPTDKSTITLNYSPFSFSWTSEYAPNGFVIRLEKEVNGSIIPVLNDVDIGSPQTSPGNFVYDYGGIEENAHYLWRIGAKKNNGTIKWSKPLDQRAHEFITVPIVSDPKIISVIPHVDSADVIWSNDHSWDPSWEVNHFITYAPNGQNNSMDVDIPENGSYTISNLASNTTYNLYLTAEYKIPLRFSDGSPAQDYSRVVSTYFTTLPSNQNSDEKGYFIIRVKFDACGCEMTPWLITPSQQVGHPVDEDTGIPIETYYQGIEYTTRTKYGPVEAGLWQLKLVIKNLPSGTAYNFSSPPYIDFIDPSGNHKHIEILGVDYVNGGAVFIPFQVLPY